MLTKSTSRRNLLAAMKKLSGIGGRYHHGDLERALLSTALQVIAEDGLEGLTLRNVGGRVGVSRSALYRHFDDKAALLTRIATDGFRLLAETLRRVRANAGPDAGDTLEVMAAAHVHFAHANPSHYATMFASSTHDRRRGSAVAPEADEAFGELVDAVRDAQRCGRIGDADPVAVAEVMWSLTFGLARLGTTSSVEELAVRGVRWVSDGCQPPTEPSTVSRSRSRAAPVGS
jgi:AcrR family transcriptional regulator